MLPLARAAAALGAAAVRGPVGDRGRPPPAWSARTCCDAAARRPSGARSRSPCSGRCRRSPRLRDPSLAAYHGGRAQGDRRLRAGPRPRRRAQGARALRLEPDRPDARPLDRRPGADRALIDEPGPLARGIAALAGVGAAVELFVFAERHPDSAVGRAVHGPGTRSSGWSRLASRAPEQLEVGGRGPERNPTGWSARLPIPSDGGHEAPFAMTTHGLSRDRQLPGVPLQLPHPLGADPAVLGCSSTSCGGC